MALQKRTKPEKEETYYHINESIKFKNNERQLSDVSIGKEAATTSSKITHPPNIVHLYMCS